MDANLPPRRTAMLRILSENSEIRVKNQQLSETDLSADEKFVLMKEILCKSELQFLIRFGKYLDETQLDFFANENIDVEQYVEQLKKNLADAKLQCKNRRYAALQQMLDTTEYFSEEEMQRRNPILYDQLIGKFQSKEEKEAFLQRSCAAAASKTPLTDLLMAHMERNNEGESYRRLGQEKQKADEEEADAEYRVGDGGERRMEMEDDEEIEDEEKELFREEFYTTMYTKFLEGKDEDFDYSSVDNNESYDVGENLELDEEEKYFGGEEPSVCEVEENSLDELFNPPTRCSEIENKIKEMSVQAVESVDYPTRKTCEDDEDELDTYMRLIEKELESQ